MTHWPDGPEIALPAGDVTEGVVWQGRDMLTYLDGEVPGDPIETRGLVDFDLAGTTTRATDLANTAMHWVPLADPADRPAELPDNHVFARCRVAWFDHVRPDLAAALARPPGG